MTTKTWQHRSFSGHWWTGLHIRWRKIMGACSGTQGDNTCRFTIMYVYIYIYMWKWLVKWFAVGGDATVMIVKSGSTMPFILSPFLPHYYFFLYLIFLFPCECFSLSLFVPVSSPFPTNASLFLPYAPLFIIRFSLLCQQPQPKDNRW